MIRSLVLFVFVAIGVLAQAPITFQYFYDGAGELIKVVDSTGIVIEYVYDEVGNMLEIKRSSIPPPSGLFILSFAPAYGPPLTTLTIRGGGFSPTSSSNTVRIGDKAATVLSASANVLTVAVSLDGMTGAVAVQVGAETAMAPGVFTVIPAPVITSISRRSVLQGSPVIGFQVAGTNLTGSTFSLQPVLVPPLTTSPVASVNANGTLAVLSFNVSTTAVGSQTVIATSASGSSSAFASSANTFSIVKASGADSDGDGLADELEAFFGTDPYNPDTDGDGFSDGVEVAAGSDPLNPSSTPLTGPKTGHVNSKLFSVLNPGGPSGGDPRQAQSVLFSVLNDGGSTPVGPRQAESGLFSVLNGPSSSGLGYTESSLFSVKNSASMTSSLKEGLMSVKDSDGDGLPDELELRLGTNAFLEDSDGDGYPDWLEVELRSDPLHAKNGPSHSHPSEAYSVAWSVKNTAPLIAGSRRKPEATPKGDSYALRSTTSRP